MTKIYTLTSWNNTNPQQVAGLDAARVAAEQRAIAEGKLVKISALAFDGADYLECQSVDAAGRWSKLIDEPLPGSRSELDMNDADAEE